MFYFRPRIQGVRLKDFLNGKTGRIMYSTGSAMPILTVFCPEFDISEIRPCVKLFFKECFQIIGNIRLWLSYMLRTP